MRFAMESYPKTNEKRSCMWRVLSRYTIYLSAYATTGEEAASWVALLCDGKNGERQYFHDTVDSATFKEILLMGTKTVFSRFDAGEKIVIFVDDKEFVDYTLPLASMMHVVSKDPLNGTMAGLAQELHRLDVMAFVPYADFQRDYCTELLEKAIFYQWLHPYGML